MSNKYSHKTAGKEFEAKAPYNFVPLPEKVFTISDDEEQKIRAGLNDKYHSDRHTGYIDLEITTETPLYTRCAIPAEVWKNQDHFENGKPKVTSVPECQDFFHHGNPEIPIIPGSTLRGMTRALVEILSYGKINFVTNKRLVYRSVAQNFYRENFSKESNGALDYPISKLKAGYLEINNGEYYIRPALVDENGNSFVRIEYREFEKVKPQWQEHKVYKDLYVNKPEKKERESSSGKVILRFFISTITKDFSPESKKVSVICSGHMSGKTKKHMHYAVYEPNNDSKLIHIDPDLWKVYEEDRDMTRGIKARKLEKPGDPLFYLLDDQNKLVFFGSTMMFRLPYPNTILDFIPEDLRCGNKLDLAEAIFGQVEENKHLAGRVFFSDAVWKPESDEQNPFLKEHRSDDGRRIPKILSSPKPTSFQLYLNQPIVDKIFNKIKQNENTLKSYYDKGETIIRGFKRYWHKKPNQKEIFEENYEIKNNEVFGKSKNGNDEGEKNSQHTIIRPVKQGTKFCGKVYFENLNDLELGALLIALKLDSSMRHQIGMAKPYGLGSIKVDTKVFLQDREVRYASLFDDSNNIFSSGNEIDNTLQKTQECEQAFIKAILSHCSMSEEKCLKDIPRLRELFVMLKWDGISQFSNKSYADLEQCKDMWRQRHVLPLASEIEELASSFCITKKSISNNPNSEKSEESLSNRFEHYKKEIELLGDTLKDFKDMAKKILKKFKDHQAQGKILAKKLLEKQGSVKDKNLLNEDWYTKIKQMAHSAD